MEEGENVHTLKDKILFILNALFIALGFISFFLSLYFVSFVIIPTFNTISMQFEPAMCVTAENIFLRGTTNCTWSSCRQDCYQEMYNCTQIRVHYKIPSRLDVVDATTVEIKGAHHFDEEEHGASIEWSPDGINRTSSHKLNKRAKQDPTEEAINNDLLAGVYNESEWSFTRAKLYPNLKGCNPPGLNCSIFFKNYITVGTNFSCYYSKVDPSLVISEFNIGHMHNNLILAFLPFIFLIILVIYFVFTYFYVK